MLPEGFRRFVRVALWTIAFVTIVPAWGTTALAAYPDRPIHLIVPFPPGGPNDILGRLVGQHLSKQLGKQIVVENHPGASTIIGTEFAAKAAADGYTLLMVSPSSVINPGLRTHLPYDLLRDFVPVIEVAVSPNVLVTNPSVPVKTVADLLAMAKANPGEINFGSGGVGTATHLGAVLLCDMGNVKMNHIPYKGAGPATIDLLGGRITWMFGTILSVKPYIDAGKLNAIAVSGPERVAALPNVPTVAETLPGFDATSLYGIMVRRGTPPDIVKKLNAELQMIISSQSFRDQLSNNGAQAVGGTPAEFERTLKSSIDKWTKVIKSAGIKPE